MNFSESRIAADLPLADGPEAPGDPDAMTPPSCRPVAAFLPDGWLTRQVATNSERIEHCQATERVIRERVVLRAKLTWDGDRRLEATLLGGKLARDPERVVARLRESLHGVDWLLSRWSLLIHAGQAQGGWNGDQARLASELFGTPQGFQYSEGPDSWVDFGDPKGGPPTSPALDLARRAVAELKALRISLVPLDEQARARAEAGLAADSDPEMKRLRRHEATLHNRLRWTLEQIEELAADAESTPELERETKVAASQKVQAPAHPSPGATSRVEARLKKAEDRRLAQQRKRERQRA